MNIIIYLASAANGMISNQRNVPDWLSPEYGQGFMEMAQRTKAVIMGKTTYNILAPDYLPLKEEGTLLVLTHNTQMPPPQNNIVFTNQSPHDIVALLESRGHTEAVIIGGTLTASAFLKAGLVNELCLVVEPVLFDRGLPLMKDVDQDFSLILMQVKQLNANTVQLHYAVKN
ncbi:MAG: dihydrofolate reductase family protein [Agriterribacter sp.]